MADYKRKQGDDITLSISVGTDVSIDDLAELYVYITNERTKAISIKFSKGGATGFTALDRISATVYEAIWPSGNTKDAKVDTYVIEGNVVETDADYEDSEENTITIKDKIILETSTSKASSSG